MCPIGYNTPDDGPHVCVCDVTRNHVMDHELNLCGCIAGYEYDSGTGVCSLCPTNFEKNESGAQACTMCPIGYNTPDNGPHVCVCDSSRNHVIDEELNMCGCIAGYGYDSEFGNCSLCPANFEKTAPGAQNCTMCSIGYNTPDNGPHVCVCDATRNHVMDHELKLCGCIAGYEYNLESGVCSLCSTEFEKRHQARIIAPQNAWWTVLVYYRTVTHLPTC